MNERIKELEKQCWSHRVAGTLVDGQLHFDTEKFAEMLIEKFDDILVLEYVDCIGNKDKQAEERIRQLREKVKTYFGVEE